MAAQIRGFILEKGMKGLSTAKIDGKLSLRASITGEIVMEASRSPPASCLPNVAGLKGPFGCLNRRPLRHFLGRDGRGGGLLAPVARLCA